MSKHPTLFLAAIGLFGLASRAAATPAAAADTLHDMLTQTACLAEGDVTNITTTYDAYYGPRTMVTLSNVVSRLGTCPGSTITISQMTGPMPNGRTLIAPKLPRFFRGAHYVVFLRNTDWRWSPVLFGHAYRAETVAGIPVLIDQLGTALQRIDYSGLVSGTVQLFNPVNINTADPYARPTAVIGVTANQIPIALNVTSLVSRLQSFANAEKITISGSVTQTPVMPHAWNQIPGSPVPATGTTGGGCSSSPTGCVIK